jgi:hypothetical protein
MKRDACGVGAPTVLLTCYQGFFTTQGCKNVEMNKKKVLHGPGLFEPMKMWHGNVSHKVYWLYCGVYYIYELCLWSISEVIEVA